ncbi:MAG: DsrH/TusB family sulfur metabolism protein [Candidatus Bathyarchaeota archaeon]|nr:DsrH/TusB family sulfur metabolism protein [Candidatus Bathyarchaeota archaeon]
MVSFTVLINEAPIAKERAFTALRFATTCSLEGHEVKVFLMENGVYVAKKGQNPSADAPNLLEYLEELIKGKVEVKACVVCCQARGLTQDDLVDGVKIASMHELVEWTANTDKTIVF